MKHNNIPLFLSIILSFFICGCDSQFKKDEIVVLSKEDRIDEAIAHEIEITKDLSLGIVPKERLLEANNIRARLLSSSERSARADITWHDRGPDNVGGRTRGIIFDQADTTNNTILAGSVSGGIWRGTHIFSENPVWNNLTPDLSNLAISSLAQDPGNPDVIYAGTGEGWFNGDAVRGVGIYKSTDGGTSWTLLPSTSNSRFRYVMKLMFDSSSRLYACTRNDGLLRSTDGGESWTKILGGGLGGNSERAADVEFGLDGAIYASLGVYSIDGMFRSDDDGQTWKYLHGGEMPTTGYRRIEIAVSKSDTNRVYAVLEASGGECLGIYRSDDKGDSWTSLDVPESTSGLVFGRNQLWYDLTAEVDPKDPNHVVIGGVNLFHSYDGGDFWIQMTNWFQSDRPYVHADQHNILFDPSNSNRVLFANDGGIFYNSDFNGPGRNYEHSVDGYNVTQFYSCAIHPLEDNIFSGGTQDNGTHIIESDDSNSSRKISGGDGGFTHFAGFYGEFLITSFTNNNYNIYLDYNFYRDIDFDGGSFINPTTTIDYYLYGNAGNGQYFRVDIAGFYSEELIEVDALNGRTIRHISPSPNVHDRLYIGTNNGTVVYVDSASIGIEKDGVTILNRSGNISCVAVEPGNEDHIIVTVSNYGEINVLETRNGGQSWLTADIDLPDMPVRWAAFAPNDYNQVLLATEAGIWRTDSIAGAWTQWYPDPNFPNTRTDMIKTHKTTGRVLVGTHGRGFFVTDDFAVNVNTNDVNKNIDKTILLSPNPATANVNWENKNKLEEFINIFDINGKLVHSQIASNGSINVENIPVGLYILKIKRANQSYTGKFIKQ